MSATLLVLLAWAGFALIIAGCSALLLLHALSGVHAALDEALSLRD